MALPQGRVHALHGRGLREILPHRGTALHRARHGWSLEPGCPHRLQGLRGCLPFDIPRYNEANVGEKVYKCDLATRGSWQAKSPACAALSCPTGALTIGEKDAMIKKAYDRVKELGGDANVYGDKFVKSTHVIYAHREARGV